MICFGPLTTFWQVSASLPSPASSAKLWGFKGFEEIERKGKRKPRRTEQKRKSLCPTAARPQSIWQSGRLVGFRVVGWVGKGRFDAFPLLDRRQQLLIV
ncbi:hypothetical protein F5Y02DRAFT_244538 [Annulohypoxylon stygium]|nr:hypothetical protein F5Y02DRAFT_244538 [Annulohypoxylon stygium]